MRSADSFAANAVLVAATLVAATLVTALAAGCATSVDVSFDDRRDFSRDRTWAWIPQASSVRAPPAEEAELGKLTSRLVDRELGRHGLTRAHRLPDLLVRYELQVQRQLVATNETSAERYLSSHHASPSYLVQASTTRIDVYHDSHLRIVVTDGRHRERVVWRGELRARRRGGFAHHLPDVVAQLLEQFPTTSAAELSTSSN